MRILIKCKECGNEMDGKLKVCPECGTKKPFYKKGWFGAISFIVVVTICASIIGSGSSQTTQVPITNESVETYSESTPDVDLSVTTDIETNTNEVEDDVPTEYKSALKKAYSYSNSLHLSKKGIYDQLVSEHGGKFSPESAQYAIDKVEIDYKYNALQKANSYQKTLSLSPRGVYDQLVSPHGGQFTEEEAQYAIDNLE